MSDELPKVEPKGFWDVMYAFFGRRLSSPIISSFVISWCISNYKVILILFSGATLDNKMRELNDYFHGPFWLVWPHSWIWIIGAPALATIVYIFVYPHINLWVMEFVNANDNKLKTQEELNQYKKVVDVLKAEKDALAKLVQDSEAELKDTKTVLTSKILEIEEMEAAYRQTTTLIKNDLSTYEQQILQILYEQYDDHRPIAMKELQSIMGKRGTKVPAFNEAFDNLLNRGMIRTHEAAEGTLVTIQVSGAMVMGYLNTVRA